MSEISSAIRRLIKTWLTGGPPKIVHDESTEPVEHDKAQIELRDIVIRQTERSSSGERVSIESTISLLIGPGCDLSGKHLSGAQLEGVDLRGANFRGARLSSANLKGANLSGADFTDAQLVFAQLRDAIVVGANFTNVNLTGANMVGVDLSTANMSMAKMLNTTTTGDIDFYTYLKAFNPDWEPKK